MCDIPPEEYKHPEELYDWRAEVRSSLALHTKFSPSQAENFVCFFERAFDHTQHPARAWFGIHPNSNFTISLVTGGIYFAAIIKSGSDKGLWLLVDWPVQIEGIEYHPAKSTVGSKSPLNWAHAKSLEEALKVIPALVADERVWDSFASATEKIYDSARISADRDALQIRRKNRRLSEFYAKAWPDSTADENDLRLLPEEIENGFTLPEGAKRQITVNAYERSDSARRSCIEHYGKTCSICGFSFEATYGELAKDIIHVHHLRQLSEIGEEYQVDPIKDLCPVCPNCHAVIHSRRNPPLSIEEVKELLRKTRG